MCVVPYPISPNTSTVTINWLAAPHSAPRVLPRSALFCGATTPLNTTNKRIYPVTCKKVLTHVLLPLRQTPIPFTLSTANSMFPETLDTNVFCLCFACVLLSKQTNKHIMFHSLSYSNITETVLVTLF